ncbi:hypothetical protein SAMN05192533_115128 [Mesobacillus persicus]|uniref:Pullulanase n=1 Tax=Mesobacillus persicus TaxID=930146 RepID=A0A1H8HTA2_9BACI|nr:DUF6509 family protein [Mesobacillus persicus]SEN59307.1 hypothetical protein SAMN05192533_115128 [Mesobacillus persicus]
MEITGHTVEVLEDPFGLLDGERFEFFLNIAVDEEDELYTENGLLLKVIFTATNEESRILQYYFVEQSTEKILDFALEDDEENLVKSYCKDNIPMDDAE